MEFNGEGSMQQPEIGPVITRERYDAVLFDLDGVITDTANIHEAYWKQMFDEPGTVEHLLVMPVRLAEIMIAKIWANGLVVVLAATASLLLVVHEFMNVPLAGSVPLFVAAAVLYQFSVGALAILLATFTGTMAQYGLLIIPVVTVLDLMSGATTPMESMPVGWQYAMQFTPTPHYVALAQAVLYRGAGLDIVWPEASRLRPEAHRKQSGRRAYHFQLHPLLTSDRKAYRSSASFIFSAPAAALMITLRPTLGSRSTVMEVTVAPTRSASARTVSSISRSTSAGLNSFPTAVIGSDGEILIRFGIAARSGMIRAACSSSSCSVTVAPGFS